MSEHKYGYGDAYLYFGNERVQVVSWNYDGTYDLSSVDRNGVKFFGIPESELHEDGRNGALLQVTIDTLRRDNRVLTAHGTRLAEERDKLKADLKTARDLANLFPDDRDKRIAELTRERDFHKLRQDVLAKEYATLEAELEKARVKLANPYQFPLPFIDSWKCRAERAEAEVLRLTYDLELKVNQNVFVDNTLYFRCPCGCGQHLTAPRMASHFCAKIP